MEVENLQNVTLAVRGISGGLFEGGRSLECEGSLGACTCFGDLESAVAPTRIPCPRKSQGFLHTSPVALQPERTYSTCTYEAWLAPDCLNEDKQENGRARRCLIYLCSA